EPAQLTHVTLGAVGNRQVEVADPFTHGGKRVVPDAARDRVQPETIPPIPPATVEVWVGAAEARHGGEELLPPALRRRRRASGPARLLTVRLPSRRTAALVERQGHGRGEGRGGSGSDPKPPLQPEKNQHPRVDALEMQLEG